MVITEEKKKDVLNMILKKASFGTAIGLCTFTALYLIRFKRLATFTLGYSIGYFLQEANQELIKQIKE